MLMVEERQAALAEIQGEARRGELIAAHVGRPPERRQDPKRWQTLLQDPVRAHGPRAPRGGDAPEL